MKKMFCRKLLPFVLSVSMVMSIVIPYGMDVAKAEPVLGDVENVETQEVQLPVTEITEIITVGYEENKISWKLVEDVDGYDIYRSENKDTGYKVIKSLPKGDSSFVDSSCKINKVYYYKIATFKEIEGVKYYGDMSQAVKMTTKLMAPSNVKAESYTYDKIKINWSPVQGATGYMVYVSSKVDGPYKRVHTTKDYKKRYFINFNRKLGETYYYKVAAYKTTTANEGIRSSAVSACSVLDQVKFNTRKIKKYNRAVTLHWNKVTGASGYKVYRYNGERKEYVLIKTLKGDSTYYTDKNLNSKKVYAYRVRAYKIVDGKIVYGPRSDRYKKLMYGWKYVDNNKLYYNKSGHLVKDVRSIIGKQKSYVIKVNKTRNVVTAYAKDNYGKYVVPVVSFICSSGKPTPVGTFYTPAKYRWHELMGPSWGQWNTRIYQGFLFHSVYYMEKNNNKTLPVNTYNRLGQTESHGCIRLRAGDAKWIYDNCHLKTKVIIYKSNNPGPFGKPHLEKLPGWHTWDPTDPTAYKYCRAHHCHGK